MDLLPDTCNDRVVKYLISPPHKRMPESYIFRGQQSAV